MEHEDRGVEAKVREYRLKVAEKLSVIPEVTPAAVPDSRDTSDSSRGSEEGKRKAKVEVEITAKVIAEDGKLLSAEVNKIGDWGLEEDMVIETAVRNVENWKKRMERLVEKLREVEKLTNIHSLDNTSLVSSVALVETLRVEMEIAIGNIQYEDTQRYPRTLLNLPM